MEKAKVYFTDFRTKPDVSQGVKLQKLCRRAGTSILRESLLRSRCISESWAITRICVPIT